MAKYAYPAVLTREEKGGYSVLFADLEGCYTQGDDLPDALDMANDVLEFTLYHYETTGKAIPPPSDMKNIKTDEKSIVSLVAGDTMSYHRKHNAKAVKKTLTIPEWLNEEAEKRHVNFSSVLQNALIEHLNSNS